MWRNLSETGETATGLGGETFAAIRRSTGTRSRRWLVAITLLTGLFAAVAMVMATPPADRTFVTLSGPAQSLMSVIVPLFGVLLAHDLRRAPRTLSVVPTLLAASLLAAVIGAGGTLICAVALAVASPDTAHDPWAHTGAIAMGSVLVQITAQLTGTGLGLLLRPVVVAFLATIVLPMGFLSVLSGVEALRPAQAWLAPYAAARNLLSGVMTPIMWAQWGVVLLIWGVGLNAAGTAWLRRRKPGSEPARIVTSGAGR